MPLPQKKECEKPKTARERVYEEVKEWIVDGTLKPGERIFDQEIAGYFSVSRTPVREALQLLSDQGLINVYPGRGTCVSEIDIEEINSIYRISADLHSLSLELAYKKITGKTIQELRQLNEDFYEAEKHGHYAKAGEWDRQFHDVFLRLAANRYLTEFTNTLGTHIRRVQMMNDPYYNLEGKKSDSYEQHLKIINALEQKDMEAAKEMMRQNWLHTIEIAKTKNKDRQ